MSKNCDVVKQTKILENFDVTFDEFLVQNTDWNTF